MRSAATSARAWPAMRRRPPGIQTRASDAVVPAGVGLAGDDDDDGTGADGGVGDAKTREA